VIFCINQCIKACINAFTNLCFYAFQANWAEVKYCGEKCQRNRPASSPETAGA
jgi:hypothetical protein